MLASPPLLPLLSATLTLTGLALPTSLVSKLPLVEVPKVSLPTSPARPPSVTLATVLPSYTLFAALKLPLSCRRVMSALVLPVGASR